MPHGRFVVVPASYVFLTRGSGPPADGSTEVLLQLRQNTGYMDDHWAAAAAGHVEAGETIFDAAQREAAEELDVRDLELDYVTVMQRTKYAKPIDERVDFFFTARSWSGEPRILEPTKCAELRWCRLDEIDDLSHPVVPHEREVLLKLRTGYVPTYLSVGFTGS